MGVKGKVAIVTGAGAGIGRETALLFAEMGAKVVVNSVTPANGEETLRRIQEKGGEGIYICADVSVEEDVQRIVNGTVQAYGRVDVLVNNAGVVIPGTIETTTLEDYERTMAVNVKSVFMMCRRVVPIMRVQGGGCIVNTASILASKGVKDRIAYAASKGAVISMSRALAVEVIRENIRVNCVSPGATYTPSLEARIQASPDPEAMLKEFNSRQPTGRMCDPQEVARTILFAADEQVSFMTGQDLHVDGGFFI